jgi:glyoxylase-like metal-dependent hydrolase (beta-lactamase superfamily II)
MKEESCFTDIEGIFITHYHDDHTNFIPDLQDIFNCPVYVCKELGDILKNPTAYRMPAMTEIPIENTTIVPEAHKMYWKEFEFTFYYFPGQTIYHDALYAKHKSGESILFVGDSFSPSGLDDYCLQNRNFIQADKGYLYCLDFLANIPAEAWLVNQHIKEPFRFSRDQIDFMKHQLSERESILRELVVWDDPNYGIDEQWARFYPYSQKVKLGKSYKIQLVITNHSDHKNYYNIKLNNTSSGIKIYSPNRVLSVQPKDEAKVIFSIDVSRSAETGHHVFTADIGFDKWKLHEWCEFIIEVNE